MLPETGEAEDSGLVARALDGDTDAFGVLVDRYHRRAISVAYRILGNEADAHDASQDAFVRAYRHLGQLEDPAKFGGWLLRVVGNLALNFRRSRARRRAVSVEEPIDAGLIQSADTSLSPDLKSRIDQAIAGLPEAQRLALVLFSVEQLPQRDVAEILDCSVEMVKWNVFQARKKLKSELADLL